MQNLFLSFTELEGGNSLYSGNIVINRKFNRRVWVLWKHKFKCSPLCYSSRVQIVWGWSGSLKRCQHTPHIYIVQLYESITHMPYICVYMVQLHESSILLEPNRFQVSFSFSFRLVNRATEVPPGPVGFLYPRLNIYIETNLVLHEYTSVCFDLE